MVARRVSGVLVIGVGIHTGDSSDGGGGVSSSCNNDSRDRVVIGVIIVVCLYE